MQRAVRIAAVCALDLKVGLRRRRTMPPWALAAAIVLIFAGVVGVARVAGYWHTSLPDRLYFDLVPRAAEFSHPR